jgi:hypothetical protein
MPKPPDEIRIEEEEDEIGTARELGPKEKARLRLAGGVLFALLAVILAAFAGVIFAPKDRLPQADEFLSFVKTVVPPLVTLVLGFYFNSQGSADD